MAKGILVRRWTPVLGAAVAMIPLASGTLAAAGFVRTNLVTDDQAANPATLTDAKLKNPWGISFSTTSTFWVSDNGSSLATLYQINAADVPTKINIEVTIPDAGTVTGQVANPVGTAFNGDSFLFVSEDGGIYGWRNALASLAERLRTPDPANVYKGLAAASIGGHAYLYAANFHSGNIDILKGDTGAPDLTGRFTDPNLPAGFGPFGIQKLGNTIYVSYAVLNTAGREDVPGPGNGIVDAFDLQGNIIARIGTRGTLNSPWGLAIAPSSFGAIAGDLLVGNFGDGRINVFDPNTHAFVDQLRDPLGQPIVIDGLWGLTIGNDGLAGRSDQVYFTAGPNGEAHGLVGVIAVPEPASVVVVGVVGALSSRRRSVRR